MSQVAGPPACPTRILVPGQLPGLPHSESFFVFINSGSDENFIDYDLCSQAQLRLDLLPEPKEVFALDGRFLARVTHRTTPVSLLLSGNHQELICFLLFPTPHPPSCSAFPG